MAKQSDELARVADQARELEIEEASNRQLRKELTTIRKEQPHHVVARLLTSVTAAGLTTYADTQIGDGKGDGIKIGAMIASAAGAGAAYKLGKHGLSNVLQDAFIGVASAEVAIATKDAGIEMAAERAKKQAAEKKKAQEAAAQQPQPAPQTAPQPAPKAA